jgi:hypothetical protein
MIQLLLEHHADLTITNNNGFNTKKSSWILDQQQQHKYDRGTSKEYSATQYNKAIGFQVSGKKIFYENFSQQKYIFGPHLKQ